VSKEVLSATKNETKFLEQHKITFEHNRLLYIVALNECKFANERSDKTDLKFVYKKIILFSFFYLLLLIFVASVE